MIVKVPVNVPASFSVKAEDYHEFDSIQEHFRKLLGLHYEYEEVGCDGLHEAVFYMDEKPQEMINRMKKKYEE